MPFVGLSANVAQLRKIAVDFSKIHVEFFNDDFFSQTAIQKPEKHI
jgi:hypothetical protein